MSENQHKKENNNQSVSIVVPVVNDLNNLIELLNSLKDQILLPAEIVISDSSSDDQIHSYIQNLSYCIEIKYLRVGRAYRGDRILHFISSLMPQPFKFKNISKGRAYPYEATNQGAKLAKGYWLAFLDSTTIPKKDWLRNYLLSIQSNNYDLAFGKTKYFAKTFYQKIFRAATWGENGIETMPGTVIKKNLYFPIKEGVRAGGDVEWRNKAKERLKWNTPSGFCLMYFNIPKNFIASSKKLFVYQLHSARVNIQHTVKDIYLGLFLLLSVLIIPKWNYLIGGWDSNPYFIPNITKIYLISFATIMMGILIVNRGILGRFKKDSFLINMLKIVVFSISVICVYRWNQVIAGWVEDSIWYVPHITKIYFALIFATALTYRGLYLPITHGIKLNFLFPFNFLVIGVLGILNDLVKAPGYLLGSIISSFIRK
jgi:glycosyltransferase involved in cell wall biosynthesis